MTISTISQYRPSVLSIGILLITVGLSVSLEYNCPNECKCVQFPERLDAVQVYCELPDKIQYDQVNFSIIQTNHTVALLLKCHEYAFPSELYDDMFSHLTYLEELSLINCQFPYIPELAFTGLRSLKALHIDKAKGLSFHQGTFHSTPSIESFSIINSFASSFPEKSLCSLRNLTKVDLGNNLFRELRNTGLLCDKNSPLEKITSLDLSDNLIQSLEVEFNKTFPSAAKVFLSNNRISYVANGTFSNLKNLLLLGLSRNQITDLPEDFLENCALVTGLGLSNNDIRWRSGMVAHLKNLIVLELDRVQVGNQIWDELYHMTNMLSLQLRNTGMTMINKTVLARMRSLQYLYLGKNWITSLSPFMFQNQINLVFLDLSENNLTAIHQSDFQGLKKLLTFDLCCNNIEDIRVNAFDDLTAVSVFNLSYNSLNMAPIAVQNLLVIEVLDLGHNYISLLPKNVFQGLGKLKMLSLKNNEIKYVPSVFHNCKSLQILNMAHNNITDMDYAVFWKLRSLHILNLDTNMLSDIKWFFSPIPNIEYLYLGNNLIKTVDKSLFPNSVKVLDLSSNIIYKIEPSSFYHMGNLSIVNVQINNLQTISSQALVIKQSSTLIPSIYLAINPYVCDCKMAWMLNPSVHSKDSPISHLRVLDHGSIFCMTTNYSRGRLLVNTPSHDFLCRYEEECTVANCNCCNKIACKCLQICPDVCTCFHDHNWSQNIARCDKKFLSEVPANIPSATTHLQLSGNDFTRLSRNTFQRHSAVKVLYLNNSRIASIENGTFEGLRNLQTLYLNDNNIASLHTGVFKGLDNLIELYLQNNSIVDIANGEIFQDTPRIQKLFLDNNRLKMMPEIFSQLTYLSNVTLSQNPWTCDCGVLSSIKSHVTSNAQIINDITLIVCGGDDKENTLLMQVNGTELLTLSVDQLCPNITSLEVKVTDERHVTALIVVSVLVAISVCLVCLLYRYRNEVKVLIFMKVGVRFHNIKDDENKQYDAFVSYSSHDEHYIVHELAPRLEHGHPAYKLCLHYRDFPVGASIAESIVDSVESSRRTLMILSNNYLESEWCLYEFQTAHHQVLQDRTNRLIVILLEEIDEKKLEKDIKLYLKTKTYLKVDDPWFWEKLQYALPDKMKVKVKQEDNVPIQRLPSVAESIDSKNSYQENINYV